MANTTVNVPHELAEMQAGLSPRLRLIAHLILAGLLLVLAFRLTCSESLRETLGQKQARLAALAAPRSDDNPGPTPLVGPSFIAAECAITFLLAGGAILVAVRRSAQRSLSLRHIGQFLLIAAALACGLTSTFHAANCFNAIIGTADIAMALIAGWTIALLCSELMLGNFGRRIVIAALVAILAVCSAKAFMQYFIEFPDILDLLKQHPEQARSAVGIGDDPVQQQLLFSRIKSGEVYGFGAFSNVFVTELIGFVALVAALVIAAIPILRSRTGGSQTPQGDQRAKSNGKSRVENQSTNQSVQISPHQIGFAVTIVLLIGGLTLLPLTGSKGGLAAGIAAVFAIVAGGTWGRWFVSRRKLLLALAAITFVLGALAVIGHGLYHDSLPTKSLLFRWQYWRGAAPMIHNSPLGGVGLNNFGDYYPRYKLPSAPEDVKDPHNFFVRLAAEMGLPATCLIGALAVWTILGAFRATAPTRKTSSIEPFRFGPALATAGAAAILWAMAHFFLTEISDPFNLYMTLIYAVFGWSVFAAVLTVMPPLTSPSLSGPAMRYLAVSAVVAAVAMLLYDQINMALLTGAAAMLFWVLLGLADYDESQYNFSRTNVGGFLAAVCLLIGGGTLALSISLWTGAFVWDPAPYEFSYIQKLNANDLPAARHALEEAIVRSPESLELRVQHIQLLREKFSEPVAPEIRDALARDRANARIRITLALPDSDLPPSERAALLREALELNSHLPPDELQRLSPEMIATINQTISRLESATTR